MKKVAFIPIKMNNERLPNKNTKAFDNGKPLIYYILKTLEKVKELDEVYVYCSDESIKKFLPKSVKFLKRDPYLDKSTTPFNDVLTYFAKDIDADVYVLTHATAPFIKSESISKGLNKVLSGEYDSALSVKKMQEFIWKDNKPFNYDINNIPRTQDLEEMYVETCGLYVYTREVISNKRRIGDKPYLVEVSDIEAVDINNHIDLEIANCIYNSIIKESNLSD